MMHLYDLLVSPFVEFGFMRRALAGCLALALGSGPIGLFLVLRRMSLMGDAMSHAVLPGAAIGFMMAGLSLPAMSLGGFVAGVVVALLAGLAVRFTDIREDASFAAFYLLSLAVGVLLVSRSGSNVDLMHILFGSVLAVDDAALLLVAGVASFTLLTLALIYRPLLLESLDPVFLRAVGARGALWHLAFLMLVVLNLVAGFQALGTLMAVGLMMLPAITARLWAASVGGMLAVAVMLAFASGLGGLLLSYHFELPSGPAIILLAGLAYLFSLLFAPLGGALPRYVRGRHLEH
ncbi:MULTISPECIES: metal ABC transporter permease [Gulbenkiania]|uniref:ABC-type Mn2+/Zn2+ transport system, permease component n=2 Tax=Gulbenkiania TaxID=397456 RepID=A0A0K6H085_9NEIS|nr:MULTISPECIES: metal ABC transporter permease [Gulbenkiania]TCW31530.1 zinc/manganese transport system permease protein [Gulbenkiania mobilis]CUA84290.1 ABC-type Mn2+/Zn2+ transport system, permease component [Gulbenkiania indica]